MKKLFLLSLFICFFWLDGVAQFGTDVFTIGSDNASNYGGSWTNGSNQGSGFGAWSISAGANTGVFTGSPSNNGMGTTGIGTTAFGIFATGGNYINIFRTINNGIREGDILTFYWAMNFDAGSGSKGFNFKSGGTTIFNVNNAGTSTISTTNGNASTGYGTNPMLVTLERTSSSTYSFSMTARDGSSTYTTTINSTSTINEIEIYCGNQNDGAGEKNIYFNNFQVTSKYTIPGSSTSTLSSHLTVPYVEIQSGGTLISEASNSRELTVSLNGAFTNSGTFTVNDGKVIFSGSNTVSGTVAFNNVDLNGGVNFGSNSTINGNLTINSGGFVNTNAPTYGSSSTLIYNTGGTYGRADEWSSTSGAGYPNNVTISNNTTVDLSNNGVGTARQIAGNLTINSGSALTMDEMTASLTVIGDITNSGTLTLSSAVFGDLNIGGNLTNTGTITHNTRAISFTGSGQQTLSSAMNLDYFTMNNAAGLIVNGDLTIGNTLTLTNGVIDLQGGKLTLSSGATISGGSSSSYIKTSSTHGLVQAVANGSPKTFPVGNSTYNPVTIANSGTTDNFTVRVADEILDGGSSGSALTAMAVDRTWFVTEETNGGSNVSLTFQWNGADQLGSFSLSDVFPSHYNGTYWEPGSRTTASGSDPYTISLSGVESFSPFGVGSSTSILPVELAFFKAEKNENRVNLNWQTLAEINNSHFEIEKSFNGKEFDFLGKVNGNGTTNETINYSFIDNSEVNNEVFYRLKQVDLDGNFEYSEVINVKDIEFSSELDVFPNPTTGVFNLQFKEITPKTIKVRNSFGVLVNEFKIGGILQTQLDLTNQPKGLYFIEVSSEYNQEFIPVMISR